jgi:hypothetical protein
LKLDALTVQQASQNILIYEELKEVLTAFKHKDIKAITLKGAAFAETIYSHVGQRRMVDIDLLLRKQDLARADKELVKQGYIQLEKSTSCYLKSGSLQFVTDLHHKIPYLEDTSFIWQEARLEKIAGLDVLVMPLEENLIYLCYHLAVQHADPDKKWIEDLYRLVDSYQDEIDWEKLVERVRFYKFQLPCFYTLRKVKTEFNTSIFDNVLKQIKPKKSWRSKVFKTVLESDNPIESADYFLPLLIQPQGILSFCFPSVTFLQQRYGVGLPLVYLFYLLRPIFLFLAGMKGVINLLYRNSRQS